MPSTYAHYRMGREVWQALSGRERERIDAYPELYLIGLHGPDILFYYHALSSNPVNAIGYGLHAKPGKTFFEQARMAVQHSPEQDAALSYAYGVLNHFALDVSCHAYVDEKIAASGVTHTEIEVEFDRSLMLKDGLNPVTHVLTDHIQPSLGNAEVIAPFYPGATEKQIQKALHSMIFQNRMLLCSSALKRQLIYTVLRLTGNYREMHGLIVNPHGNPACEDSNARLLELYSLAIQRGKDFICGFDAYLKGETELPPIFDFTFGGIKPETAESEAEK